MMMGYINTICIETPYGKSTCILWGINEMGVQEVRYENVILIDAAVGTIGHLSCLKTVLYFPFP
jgi:hypothetical protein